MWPSLCVLPPTAAPQHSLCLTSLVSAPFLPLQKPEGQNVSTRCPESFDGVLSVALVCFLHVTLSVFIWLVPSCVSAFSKEIYHGVYFKNVFTVFVISKPQLWSCQTCQVGLSLENQL